MDIIYSRQTKVHENPYSEITLKLYNKYNILQANDITKLLIRYLNLYIYHPRPNHICLVPS